MLNENEVVAITCDYLESQGYKIIQRLNTPVHGVDIIAENPVGHKMLIEAKGTTSSIGGSKRHGKPFTHTQALIRVARGFYTAVHLHCELRKENDMVGLAYPDTELYRKLFERIKPALDQLKITVFLVQADKSVKIY